MMPSNGYASKKMHEQDHKVLRHATVVGVMTAISRVAGLVRELIMAYYFGTSAAQSAFVVAFRLPNLFRRLFGEGALSNAFIPVFTETLVKEGKEAASTFAARVMGLQSAVIGVLVILLMAATWIAEPFFPAGSRWLIIFPLMRIMLPYALLICQVAIVSAMLNTQQKFKISSLTPVILNFVWIIALVVCPLVGGDALRRITFISYAILAAGLFQLAFQIPTLRSCGLRFGFDFSITAWRSSPRIREVLIMLAPTALGAGIDQINICVDGYLAYYAADWAPAAMEYADRIAYLPLGMFSTAFVTVLMPTYSRLAALNDYEGLKQTMERALRNLAVIVAPAMTVMTFMAPALVELIYVWPNGKFDYTSAHFTALAVMAYAPGMFAFSFQKCLTPAFFAMKDTRTPVTISIICIIMNFTLNILSIIFLPVGVRHVGLISSTVFCSLVNGVVAAHILRKRKNLPDYALFAPTVVKSLIGALVMAACCVWVHSLFGAQTLKLMQLLALATAGAAGAIVYGATMWCIAKHELLDVLGSLRRRKQKSCANDMRNQD
jgi:putative peptidoglycan lipid II flippase